MKTFKKYLLLSALPVAFISCDKGKGIPAANNLTLNFNNTFKTTTIIIADTPMTATINTSAAGQTHRLKELKYVISNIRLVKDDGTEFPYHVNNLDKGAVVVNQAKKESLSYVLSNVPTGDYKQIKFGLGVKKELNTLDQVKFPKFYNAAGANDLDIMWDWGIGYRFLKLEGYYGADNKQMSIHFGSTEQGKKDGERVQGVDAYRDILLALPTNATVGRSAPQININADFDKLLSGKTNTITLTTGTTKNDNAITPNIHTANLMVKFVDNLGGNGKSDLSGMFSISSVKN